MKKIIAFAMSALLAVSAIPLPVSAEPAASSVLDVISSPEWTQQARPVSPEELAEVYVPKKTITIEDTVIVEPKTTTPVIYTVEPQGSSTETEPLIPAPVLAQVTATTIVLEKVEGYDFYVNGGHRVYRHSNGIFTNLEPNTEYKCYYTTPGGDKIVSEPLIVITGDRTPCVTTPKAPMVSEYSTHSIVLVRREGYEYRINDGPWVDYYSFSDLEPDTEYTFYQRIKQTRAELASEISEPLRARTAPVRTTSQTNLQQLLKHIEANGFEDELGQKTLAYVIVDDYGTEYYFLMYSQSGCAQFNVFSYSEAADSLLFSTEFGVGPYDTFVQLDFAAALYTGGECVDYVDDFMNIDMQKYHIGDQLTVDNSGIYLSSADLSALCTATTQMLFEFWDEDIYNTLGFGFRGLGFVVTEGYGDFACATQMGVHFGDTVIQGQREPECLVDGCDGVPYCTLCGLRMADCYGDSCKGYHTYDNNCDTACNDCGEIRYVPHLYLYACATQCNVCGEIRTEALAGHSFDADRLCTKCGHKGHLLGDVSGDDKVNMGDVAKVYAHTRGRSLMTDSDALDAADTNGDGKINLGDTARILAHVTGKKLLW